MYNLALQEGDEETIQDCCLKNKQILSEIKKIGPSESNLIKIEDINNIDNKDLISINERDTLVKFRQFY